MRVCPDAMSVHTDEGAHTGVPLQHEPFLTKYNPDIHHRHSIRLRDYDYSQAGAYFLTICTKDRECLFGEILDGGMRLDEYGSIVQECWDAVPKHFNDVQLDEYVVMPNHFHGIVIIAGDVGARHAVPLRMVEQFGKPVPNSLPTVIRSFKSAVTKKTNVIRGIHGIPLWQRNYYEHVMRNEEELNGFREYIHNNPMQWEMDEENPERNEREEGA